MCCYVGYIKLVWTDALPQLDDICVLFFCLIYLKWLCKFAVNTSRVCWFLDQITI